MSVILIINSDPKVCEFAETGFPLDHCVIGVPDWDQALEVLEDISFDLVLIDGKLNDSLRNLQECPILLFAEGTPTQLETLSQGIMADGYIEKILDAEHILTQAQAHLANQAHSFPEGMSHSSCQLEIGAFSKRMNDTHKFVRKRSQSGGSLGLCREETATQNPNEVLESSSF